jgi:hypothetical protein
MGRKREESGSELHESRMKPYHICFEGNTGLLAREYAKFPNKVLWKLTERCVKWSLPGRLCVWKIPLGTDLTALMMEKDYTACSSALAIHPDAVTFPGAAAACSTATAKPMVKFI